jgi:hypothetical protein
MRDDIERIPVPENRVERFMFIIYSMVEDFGIDQVPEVYRHVELLGEAVDRHIWEERHKVSPSRRVHGDRKRFISIFRARYLQLTDLEYHRQVTPIDAKLVNQVNRTLHEAGHDAEEYLKWLFENFLVENPKFCPPTMKQVCSNFFIHKFLYESKQGAVVDKEEESRKMEAQDLVARGRLLLRSGLSAENDEKVREKLKEYSEGHIIIHELRQFIEAVERGSQGKEEGS